MAGISKRVSGAWVSGSERIMKTATDIIVSPTTIYADGTNAIVGLKGNMSQTGTPTPTNPIQPSECGDLETEGAHAGQYKIPISSANTTTPVYLGEVESTRRIKKLVLTGSENWYYRPGSPSSVFFFEINNANFVNNKALCTHYVNQDDGNFDSLKNKHLLVRIASSNTKTNIGIRDSNYPSSNAGRAEFKQWVANQYAAGTPVTVWYVLANEETGIVNEPLRKIGDYADEVSGISIPTIAGADTLSVDTTLQPSEVSVNYHGWHEGTVKDYENGGWQSPQAQALSLSNSPMLSMAIPDIDEPIPVIEPEIEPEITE